MTTKIDESDSSDKSKSLKETTNEQLINQVLQRTPSTLTQASFDIAKNTDDIIKHVPSDETSNYVGSGDETISSIRTEKEGATGKNDIEMTEHDQSQSLSAQHDLTSESLDIIQETQSEIETHDEVQHTWNESSGDVEEMLIGKKRQREETSTASSSKRAKIGVDDETESFQKDKTKGHLRRKPDQIAGTKFTRVLRQGQQIAHWLGAVCLPQTDFCRSYNKSALSFECKNQHKFFLQIN